MSYYTPTKTVKLKFDDDEVLVSFRRLKRREVMDTLLAEGSSIEKSSKLLDKLPEVIHRFEGLKAEGVDVPLATVLEEQYFQPLVKQIVEAIMEASNLGGDDSGKSPAPPPDTLKG